MDQTYFVRIHWGYWMLYGPYPYQHAHHCWDGFLTASSATIRSCSLIEFNGFCGPGRESFIPLDAPLWHWQAPNANNRLGGVFFEVLGGLDSRVTFHNRTIEFTFGIGELVREHVLRYHVGPRYSNVEVSVMLDGYDPELDHDDDLRSMTAADGMFRMLLDARAVQNSPVRRWFRTDWAWIGPGEQGDVEIPIPKSLGDAGRRLGIQLRCAAAFPIHEGETLDEIINRGTARYGSLPPSIRKEVSLPFELWTGERRIAEERQFFAYMGNVPLMEEIRAAFPFDAISGTSASLSIRNLDGEAYLLIGRVFVEEETVSECVLDCPSWVRQGIPFDIVISCAADQRNPRLRLPDAARLVEPFPSFLLSGEHRIAVIVDEALADIEIVFTSDTSCCTAKIGQVFTAASEPFPMLVGLEDKILPENAPGYREDIIRHLASTRLGDLWIFRLGSSIEAAGRIARLCRENGVYCRVTQSMGFDRARIIRDEAGPYFLGFEWTEHDGPLWGYIQTPLPDRDPEEPRTMRTAHDAYVGYVRTLVEKVQREAMGMKVWLMVSSMGHALGYEGGMDFCFSQFNKTHNAVLLADARGAARAYRKEIWGTYQAEGAHINPEGQHHLRMWRMSLHLAYMTGASFANDEECLYRTWHERLYSRNDRMPRTRRRIMREFNRYIKSHPRRSSVQVRQALLLGRYSCDAVDGIGAADHHRTSALPMVWRNFGDWTPLWRPSEAEYGLRYLDVFFPGVWLQTLEQSPDDVRRWYSGTPYGEIDIVPIDAPSDVLADYPLLMVLGWNTADEAQYLKLKAYVEGGGILFMSVPHLTRNEGREFLSNGLEPLNLVREGDFSDLFGVRIVGKGDVFGNIVSEPEADDNPIDGLTQHPSFFRFPPLPPHHDRARLAEVEVTDAEILARESESRRPVLVRRRLGRGEAYLLCTWAYPGNSWLVPFVNPLIRSLAVKSAGLISLTDGMGDVYYSVRVEGDVHRIHLLNTDWTEAENKKPCRLRLGDCWIDLEVGEGTVTEIIWIDSLVLIVDDPRLYVARIEHTGGEYRAEVHGCGSVEIQIFMIGEVKLTTLAFRDHAVRHQLDGEHGWYRAKLDFSGSSVGEMSIESNARMD